MDNCLVCKKEIPMDMVQMILPDLNGRMHINCSYKKIPVWFIAPKDDPKNGYYDDNKANIDDIVSDSEEEYIVTETVMEAGKYHALPEFTGF